jgi:ribosomal protein S18 acetylase RimI-like enzyme
MTIPAPAAAWPAPLAVADAVPDLEIRALTAADAHWQLDGLCELLEDGVRSGASLGFLVPLSRREAEQDWQDLQPTLSDDNQLWVARADGRLLGCLRLRLATSADARHRAAVERLVVRSTHRRRGIARALLAAAERAARAQGRTLLLIEVDADGSAACALQRLDWRVAGTIPGHAAAPDGTLRDGAILFRQLAPGRC